MIFTLPSPAIPVNNFYAAVVKSENSSGWVNCEVTIYKLVTPSEPKRRAHIVMTTPTGADTVAEALLSGKASCDVNFGTPIASYSRNYQMLQTFEPFRQGDKHFALISTDYVCTDVMDLQTGEIIASQEPPLDRGGKPQSSLGFCPIEFFVPDWWEQHDGSVKPGDTYWSDDKVMPNGTIGWVAGCVWGDDSSWKIQRLDLSLIQEGIITGDDRYGYISLPPQVALHQAITPIWENGTLHVNIAVSLWFDDFSGKVNPSGLQEITGGPKSTVKDGNE